MLLKVIPSENQPADYKFFLHQKLVLCETYTLESWTDGRTHQRGRSERHTWLVCVCVCRMPLAYRYCQHQKQKGISKVEVKRKSDGSHVTCRNWRFRFPQTEKKIRPRGQPAAAVGEKCAFLFAIDQLNQHRNLPSKAHFSCWRMRRKRVRKNILNRRVKVEK
jgi:hypothetical protein